MTRVHKERGGTPVGFISELDEIQAASVVYLRLWCDGPDSQSKVWNDFASELGTVHGKETLKCFEQICDLCAKYGRRPLIRHSVHCKCLGSDEACFANFIAMAAEGEREDAMMVATLLIRPDVAPLITSLATNFGMALKQMHLCAPRDITHRHPKQTTLH